MSQEIDGTIAGIAELFCPDYDTRIKKEMSTPRHRRWVHETRPGKSSDFTLNNSEIVNIMV